MKRAVDTDFNMDASPSLAPSENTQKPSRTVKGQRPKIRLALNNLN